MMRPLWMEFPEDRMTFYANTNYMFGDAFLIAATFPILEK
jgi:alpha-glucosidase (family GH31 glycosyl hydrolase)